MTLIEFNLFMDWLRGFSWYNGFISIIFHPKYVDIGIDTRTMRVFRIVLRDAGGKAFNKLPDYMRGNRCIIISEENGSIKKQVNLIKEIVLKSAKEWGE